MYPFVLTLYLLAWLAPTQAAAPKRQARNRSGSIGVLTPRGRTTTDPIAPGDSVPAFHSMCEEPVSDDESTHGSPVASPLRLQPSPPARPLPLRVNPASREAARGLGLAAQRRGSHESDSSDSPMSREDALMWLNRTESKLQRSSAVPADAPTE